MVPHIVDVYPVVPDSRGEVRKRQFEQVCHGSVTEVHVFERYLIDAKLTPTQLSVAASALANSTFEKASINPKKSAFTFQYAIEIGFLSGVTDNVGATAKESIEDTLKKKFKDREAVYSSQVFFVSGSLSEADANAIADTIYNPLIQRASIYRYAQYGKALKAGAVVPRVSLRPVTTSVVNLDLSDAELIEIGKSGIKNIDGSRRGPLALDLGSMKVIRNYFKGLGRNPNDIELESLAQTWSEHCKHTIFAGPLDEVSEGIYKRYIKGATNDIRKAKGNNDFCVSVFKDNSGAIVFDDEHVVTHKVETHNSPSALDPFGGAITGILGVNRDTLGFGLGAKPVINYYGFCFADPRDTTVLYRDQAKTQKLLSARRIMDGVIAGVNAGGNCSGIPTPQGFVNFHPRFRGKPLVFVGTVGLMPRKKAGRDLISKKAQPGDYVVMVGGRVGQDGIHGATFSSVVLDSASPATAVQIGDPITQKKMSDAVVKEARDLNLYSSITDNGAGGLSCSVAEMARESNGFEVDLATVPVKYPGLAPWQIWISESQERLTLAVPPKKWNQFQKLMASRGVEATRIGTFTESGKAIVKHKGKTVMSIELEFLHEGLPVKYQTSKKPVMSAQVSSGKLQVSNQVLLDLLAMPGVTSTAFISSQYDQEVQGSSVTKPLQGRGRVNADATVSRPLLTSNKGVVLGQGLYPEYSEADPYRMAAAAIDTAIRSGVAAGADPDYMAILDNFCWSSSDEPERLYQLKEAARACYDYATAFGTPFISGKDSMFNDFKGFDADGKPVKISAPPTLLISSISVIPDMTKSVTLDFKKPGDLIYIVGETHDEAGQVPAVDAATNLAAYRALHQAIKKDLIVSAVSLSRYGLVLALTRSAIAGQLGAVISTDGDLLSETQGRILVSVAPQQQKAFEKAMAGVFTAQLGTVTENSDIAISSGGTTVLSLPLDKATKAYHSTFKNY